MNMLNRGSLLIELGIYLALVAVLGVTAFAWFARSQRQLLRSGQSANGLMQLYSTTDLLIRDLRGSPRNRAAWLRVDNDSIIWRTKKGDFGWYAQGKSLYRIEGSYNQLASKWAKKKGSVAIQNLERITFHLADSHQDVDRIEVTMVVNAGGARHTAHECVYPREEHS